MSPRSLQRDDDRPSPASAFRDAGLSFTVQRRAIWECLAERADHPTADDVHSLVKDTLPGVSRTTVYRTLETLVQIGLAVRLGHPGASVRYDPKTHRHHHLVCEACGTVLDLEDSALDELTLPRRVAGGFRVRDFSVQLLGLCRDCSG